MKMKKDRIITRLDEFIQSNSPEPARPKTKPTTKPTPAKPATRPSRPIPTRQPNPGEKEKPMAELGKLAKKLTSTLREEKGTKLGKELIKNLKKSIK
jgi:hypothetical protein